MRLVANQQRQPTPGERPVCSPPLLARRSRAPRSTRPGAMRFQSSNLKRLMAAIVVVAGAFSNPSLRACPMDGPDEQITLARFWVVNVGDADLGVREWRCSGNASAGVPARIYTTVFVGWGEFSTRVSALAVVALAIGGVCAVGLVSAGLLRALCGRKPERPVADGKR